MGKWKGAFGRASRELRELTKKMCDGAITAEEAARLGQLLREDESARLFYLAHLEIHGRLQWQTRGARELWPAEMAAVEGDAAAVASRSAKPVAGRSRGSRGAAWSSLLALTLIGISLIAWWTIRQGNEGDNHPVASSEELNPAVAQVGRTVNAVWDGRRAMLLGQDLLPGAKLVLEHGVAEIRFHGGATLVMEGPSWVDVVSQEEVYLRSGNARVDAPKHAAGFKVSTPMAGVVDLGTSFGIRVEEGGSTEVQVFEGKVNANSVGDQTLVRDFQVTEGEVLRLDRTAGPSFGRGITPEAFPFVPVPSREDCQRRWQIVRAELLQSPDLIGFWGFDDATADLSMHQNNGLAIGGVKYSEDVPAFIGGGRSLDLTADNGFVRVPHDASMRVKDELTISFWMRGGADQHEWVRLMSKASQMNCSGWVVHRTAGKDLVRTVVGTSGRCNQGVCDTGPVFDDKWHHVVMVFNRGKAYSYLDGIRRGVHEYDHGNGLASDVDLVIGAAGADQWYGEMDFKGQLDELALFRRALDEEEILKLYWAGSQEAQLTLADNRSIKGNALR